MGTGVMFGELDFPIAVRAFLQFIHIINPTKNFPLASLRFPHSLAFRIWVEMLASMSLTTAVKILRTDVEDDHFVRRHTTSS